MSEKTYTEYAVVVNDGPSRGYVISTGKNLMLVKGTLAMRQVDWQEELVVRQRTVRVSEWTDLDAGDTSP